MKTNPAYAHLAYRKAIYTEAIMLLRRKYLADDAGDAPCKLICEEVMLGDSEVPQEEVHQFLNELETERAGLDLEMRKFEFVRKNESQRTQGSPGRFSKKASKGGR